MKRKPAPAGSPDSRRTASVELVAKAAPDWVQLSLAGHAFYDRSVRPILYARQGVDGWTLEAARREFAYVVLSGTRAPDRRSPADALALGMFDVLVRQAMVAAAHHQFAAAGHALHYAVQMAGAAAVDSAIARIHRRAGGRRSAQARGASSAELHIAVERRAQELRDGGLDQRYITSRLATEFQVSRPTISRILRSPMKKK